MTQNPRKEATDSLGLANGDAMGMSNYDNAAGANRLGPLATQGFGVHGSGFSGNFAAEGPNPYATASASFNKADTASQSSVSNPMGLQSSPNPYAEKLAQQLAALGKYAAQDSDKQQRSSTGEDNGVSFNTRDEDHATGTDAWASLGKYVKTGQEGFVYDPNGKGRSLGPAKAREIQRAEWQRQQRINQLPAVDNEGTPRTGTFVQGQLQGQEPTPNAPYFSDARPPASFFDDTPLPPPGQRQLWIDPNFLKQQGQQPSAPTSRPFNNPNSPSYRPSGPSTAAGPSAPTPNPTISPNTGLNKTIKPQRVINLPEKGGVDKYVKTAEAGDLLKALAILTGVGGLGGAAIGGLGSSLGGGNVGRGMISGGLTGAGLGLGASSGGIAGSAGLAAARDAKLAPSEDGLVTALGSALPPAFGAGTGAYAGHQLAQHLLGEEDEDEKQGNEVTPLEPTPAVYKEPTTGQKLKSKIEDNWPVAVGAGALGLGGYGLYNYLNSDKDDEDDEDEKQAGSGTDWAGRPKPSRKKLPGHRQLPSRKPVSGPDKHPGGTNWAGQPKPPRKKLPGHRQPDLRTPEEKEAVSKYAMQPADQQPRHDCNAVHPDSTHEEWIREEFSNPPTRDWEREKESSWWSGARKIASTHIPLDAVKLLKEAGYEPFPCAFFGDLLNSGVSAELIPAAVEKAAGLVGAEYVTELRDSVPGLLEKIGSIFSRPRTRPKARPRVQAFEGVGGPNEARNNPLTLQRDGGIPRSTGNKQFDGEPSFSKATSNTNDKYNLFDRGANETAPRANEPAPKTQLTPEQKVIRDREVLETFGPDAAAPVAPVAPVATAAVPPAAPVAPVAPVARVVGTDSGIPSSPTPAKATVPATGKVDPMNLNKATPAAASVTPEPGKFPTKAVGVTAAVSGGLATLFKPVQNMMDAMGIGATTESAALIKTFSGLPPESQKQIGDMLANMPPDELKNLLSNPELLTAWSKRDYGGIVGSLTPEQRAGLKEAAGADMAGFFEGLGSGEFGKTINEFTNLLGVDSLIDAVGMDSAGMNPLLKLLMVAGGALGIGGAVSGSKTAGIAGAAMFVLPLVFGALFGGAEAAVIKPPAGTDPAAANTGPEPPRPATAAPPVTAAPPAPPVTAEPAVTAPITPIVSPAANIPAAAATQPVVDEEDLAEFEAEANAR